MSSLKTWLKDIKLQEIKARNKSRRGLTLCFNFLQVPNTRMVVLTVTVMYNGQRKNAMEPAKFARVLGKIEEELGIFSESVLKSYDPICFTSVTNKVTKEWYSVLGCHRLFFVPEDCVWELIGALFSKRNLDYFKTFGISSIPVFLDTENYNTTIKFF